MHLRRWGVAVTLLAIGAVVACSSEDGAAPCEGASCPGTNGEPDASDDAATDAAPPSDDGATSRDASGGFGVDVTPSSATLTAGAHVDVTVHVQTDSEIPATIAVEDLPSGVSAKSVALVDGKGTLTLEAAADAILGTATVNVVATSGALAASTSLTLNVVAAPGSLDTSFGSDGVSTVPFALEGAWLYGLAMDPSGGIVGGGLAVVGGKSRFAAARFLGSGAIDTTFGGDGDAGAADAGIGAGTAIFDLQWPSVDSYATGIFVEPGGNIVLGGNRQRFFFAALRTNAKGVLDTSFGNGGTQAVALGGLQNAPFVAMARQPDGKIVLAGSRSSGNGNDDFAIARLEASGAIDTTFGSGDAGSPGLVVLDLGGDYDEAFGVAVQPDGKIVVVGRSSATPDGDTALVRLDANGALDPSFGPSEPTPGIVKKNFGTYETVQGVALQADGKIVVVGGTIGDGYLARFDAAGALDPSFGGGHAVLASASMPNAGALSFNAVALQPDGKILAAGVEKIDGNRRFAVVRYGLDGAPDATFGQGGLSSQAFGSTYAAAQAIALQADGRIVVGGAVRVNGTDEFGVARFWP